MPPLSDKIFDAHMHTHLCKHAWDNPRQYAKAALKAGLDGIIFTCHSPMPNMWSHYIRMAPEEFDEYVALVDEVAREFEGQLEVRLGMESDWFPGMEDWLTELHQKADFDFILGSVHPHTQEYRERFFDAPGADSLSIQRGYFEHLADAAETGLYDSLAHPDLIKNDFAQIWDFEAVRETVDLALDRIAATGVAMELNTSGLQKAISEMNPSPDMLRLIAEHDIPITLGSDSHHPNRVGENFPMALDLLAECGFEHVTIFRQRKPEIVPISTFLDKLAEGACA